MKQKITITIVLIIILAAVFVITRKPAPVPPLDQQVSEGVINSTLDLSQVYKNEALGYSLRHPTGYSIDENYQYELAPEKNIGGTKFIIPASYATGTNLSEDAYFAVETIHPAPECRADLFLDRALSTYTITESGVTYSVASTTGAAAGNRYEETVYALSGTNPCIAVRYFIHYGVFENYAEGLVQEFDQEVLIKEFDLIRHTLIVGQ